MSDKSDNLTDCIIARMPCCKRIVYVCVNEPHVTDAGHYKEVNQLIKDGCSVEHISLAAFRKEGFKKRCKECE